MNYILALLCIPFVASFRFQTSFSLRHAINSHAVHSNNIIITRDNSKACTATLRMLSDSAAESSALIQAGRVTMYSKVSCPYCKKAKELLENKYNLQVHYVDVEEADRYSIHANCANYSAIMKDKISCMMTCFNSSYSLISN